jgi:hypothetical protein
MTKPILSFLLLLICGATVGAGQRAAQWSIPEPEQRVVVCMIHDIETNVTCRSLFELINRPKDRTTPTERPRTAS